MLFERMIQAKKNLGLEEKLLNNMFEKANEEVVIGQDYIDECAYLNEKNLVDDILESVKVPEPESPNDLDADEDVENTCNFSGEPVEKEFNSTLSVEELPIFSEPSVTKKELVNFYKSHPELKGRLYPNGSFEPSLNLHDYALDKVWVKRGLMSNDVYEALAAHDRHFQELYETKKAAWNEESKKHMENIASILASKSLEDYNKHVDTRNKDREKVINEGNLELNPHLKTPLKKISKEQLKKKIQEIDFPTAEEKEESMDRVHEFENSRIRPWEDTSGNTKSFVMDFLQNYAEGDDIIQELRKDIMKIMSDLYWIREGKHENESFAIDFADALNELSISI